MSAAGLVHGRSALSSSRTIGAHADYRRSDFIFARTQSNAMRDMPWGRRIKPVRPLGELYAYAAAAFVGLILTMAVF